MYNIHTIQRLKIHPEVIKVQNKLKTIFINNTVNTIQLVKIIQK